MRACALLPAVTGNLCKPGAGFLYLNGNLRQRGIDEAYLTAPHLATGAAAFHQPHGFRRMRSKIRRERAPLIVWNMNPLASCPQQARLRRALAARGSAHGRARSVSHRHDRAGRLRAAGGELPGIRRSDRLLFSFDAVRAGQSHAAHAGVRCRIRRFSAVWRGPWDLSEPELHESDAEMLTTLFARSGLGDDFASLKAKGSIWIPAAAGGAVRRSPIRHAERAHRNRELRAPKRTGCRGFRNAVRTASGGGIAAVADAGTCMAAQYELRQRAQNSRALGAGEHCAASRWMPPSGNWRTGISHSCTTAAAGSSSRSTICGPRSPRRRARAQRPMARDRSRARQCQRIESGNQERHGREYSRCTAWRCMVQRACRETGCAHGQPGACAERAAAQALAQVLGSGAVRTGLYRAVRAAEHARLRLERIERPDRARLPARRRVHVLHGAKLCHDDRGDADGGLGVRLRAACARAPFPASSPAG